MNNTLKTAITVISILYIPLQGTAQHDYKPILEMGKSWELIDFMSKFGEPGYIERKYTLEVIKDSIVDGLHCYAVASPGASDSAIKHLLTEEDKTLFYLTELYNGEETVYIKLPLLDFNYTSTNNQVRYFSYDYHYKDGEWVLWSGYVDDYMTITEELTLDDGRKELVFDDLNLCWVEGVGSSHNYYISAFNYPSNGYSGTIMLACYKDGECIFRHEDFARLSYAEVEEVVSASESTEKIFDLRGVEVCEPRAGNIYIRGGSKFIAH